MLRLRRIAGLTEIRSRRGEPHHRDGVVADGRYSGPARLLAASHEWAMRLAGRARQGGRLKWGDDIARSTVAQVLPARDLSAILARVFRQKLRIDPGSDGPPIEPQKLRGLLQIAIARVDERAIAAQQLLG